MRATFLCWFIAAVAIAGTAARSNSSNSASSSAFSDQSGAPSETAAPAAGNVPIYPGADVSSNPGGLGMKTLPASAKIYVTSDEFAKVQTWYRGQLNGAPEMAQPGKEKTMDAFMVGHGPSAMVVMIQSLHGDTFIVVAPPM
ncbi:MAG TPA: hypothetical protein VFE36_04470 [Candidatus Baltobacteraceae bacterium]|jgi:hypothetical protein|nr:hypothetical protein [Candidatus Baltobacteraceae bacterium]